MREITLREMQQIELDLLAALDDVCAQHGLRYYIDGGTLLGAVCYDGFIPWDDDIDIKMPRPDYEKLLSLQEAFPAHIVLDPPRPGHCEYTFLKLIDRRTVLEERLGDSVKTTGVYIDVLPMDGHPADPKTRAAHFAAMSRLNGLFHASLIKFAAMKTSPRLTVRIKGFIYSILYSPWKLCEKQKKRALKYPYDKAQQVGLLVEGDPVRESFPKAWLEPPTMMEFEGRRFPAPNEAEKHLSIFYRKPISRELYYQKLPKIPSSHNHRVYWKEEPCQD